MMAVVTVKALAFCIFSLSIAIADCNSEGDTLFAWRENLADPNGVLQSWDATLVNPCTWFHVTCNSDNTVTRIDLGNAGLSGPLLPELGKLSHLQYLNVFENNISGTIPAELGNLTRLINLDLHQNELSGSIPSSLGNLRYLRWMRLNSNKLSGEIPLQVMELIRYGHLSIMNVSDNNLAASVRRTKSRGFATTIVIQDPRA